MVNFLEIQIKKGTKALVFLPQIQFGKSNVIHSVSGLKNGILMKYYPMAGKKYWKISREVRLIMSENIEFIMSGRRS